MPVVGTIPPVDASPNAWVSRSKSPHVAPPSARAVCVTGSARPLRIRDRSITSPSLHTAFPVTPWPPPRIETRRLCSSKHHSLPHVGNARISHDESWEPIDHRVEHHTRPVVAVVIAAKDATKNSRAKTVDGCVRQHDLRA